jgi:phage shock protein A
MTYRERRLRKAERLNEWADKREDKAEATLKADEVYRQDHAFNTQPGHIPIRAKVIAREDRAYESLTKASSMRSRAASIEAQAEGAIYSDDPDAIERLEQRIAELEAQRVEIKAKNAAYKKEHKDELKALTAFGRDRAMPFPGYVLTNLSGNINRQKKRLAELQAKGGRP